MVSVFGASLFAFVLVTAVTTALLQDVLSVIIVFAAYSLGMALFYAFLLAPDVAMTEAAIGAGVTTLLLLLTIAKTVREGADTLVERPSLPALLVMGAFLVALLATVPEFRPLGAADAWVWDNPAVTQYYIEFSYEDTGVTNAVSAVLAGYRGFDTFGEAVVVFAAGIGTLLALNSEVFTRE